MLLVSDDAYGILSSHDFTKRKTPPPTWLPEVKQKFDRRIEQFLQKADNSENNLFVRTEGGIQDVYDIQMVLTGLVRTV